MRRLLFALLCYYFPIFSAQAIEPERREVVVLNIQAWDGFQYKETFLPSTHDELTLIAGQDSAISFVRTEEYFWPLSRQVYVDFQKQRDVLDGTLRIETDGKILKSQDIQSYSIFYPDGAINGNGSLLWDGEANSAFVNDQQAQRDFARDFVEAQRLNTEYEHRLLESGAARANGGPLEFIPPPPPLPKPSLRLVTKPQPSFRINLLAGNYRISLWNNGKMVAGTERTLRVVSITGADDLVADIIPEERWTKPLASNSIRSRIFARPGTTLYLSLIDAQRYDEADYLSVISPQAQFVPGRQIWIRRKPSNINKIALDKSFQSLNLLKVDQTSGSSFGYVVRNAQDNETPDIKAFSIIVPKDGDQSRMIVSESSRGFEREVVIVKQRQEVFGFLLTILPLVVAIYLFVARRNKLKLL